MSKFTDQEWSTAKITIEDFSRRGHGFIASLRNAGIGQREYARMSNDDQRELRQAWLYPAEADAEMNIQDDFIEINVGPVSEMKRNLCVSSIHFNSPKAPFPYTTIVRDTKSIAVMVRGFRTYMDAKDFAETYARVMDFDCGVQDTNAMPYGC